MGWRGGYLGLGIFLRGWIRRRRRWIFHVCLPHVCLRFCCLFAIVCLSVCLSVRLFVFWEGVLVGEILIFSVEFSFKSRFGYPSSKSNNPKTTLETNIQQPRLRLRVIPHRPILHLHKSNHLLHLLRPRILSRPRHSHHRQSRGNLRHIPSSQPRLSRQHADGAFSPVVCRPAKSVIRHGRTDYPRSVSPY